MSSVPTISDAVQKTEVSSKEAEASAETMATTSPNVVYKPVSIDPQEQFEMDRQNEQSYRRNSRKMINIVIFIVACLVVAAFISVIIILLSPKYPGTTYNYEIIPTNITGQLVLTRVPNNLTIESDFVTAIYKLYNESVFSEVYVGIVVLDISSSREPETEITVLLIFTDIGDDLGAASGSSEIPQTSWIYSSSPSRRKTFTVFTSSDGE